MSSARGALALLAPAPYAFPPFHGFHFNLLRRGVAVSSSTPSDEQSRRQFLARAGIGVAAAVAAGPLLTGVLGGPLRAAEPSAPPRTAPSALPIGLELYSVRGALARDLPGTLTAVAGMGYAVVEFYAPYLAWSFPFAKQVRTRLDDLGLRCFSTHNSFAAVTPGDTMAKAIELNQILGARHIIVASPPPNTTLLDDWKRVSGQFSTAVNQLAPHGLFTGFHNHLVEWTRLAGGMRVMDVIAAYTPPEFVLQLDVGTCLEARQDPIAWIRANPGRIRSVHLKDWTPGTEADGKAFRVLFGEGAGPWQQIIAELEAGGGVEFYLIEQEGSRYSELETARRCLDAWRAMPRNG